MEGFTKIPNTVFELGLTPSQFTVLCNLIRVQSYREYKGEVEDGWFAKSQNELTKECGFGCHKRLTRVLEGMVKMNIVQIRTTKTVTYFKIDMGKMTIGQNEHMGKMTIDSMSKNDICQKMTYGQNEHMGKMTIPTMGKMTIDSMGKIPVDTMGKMPNLHNNINKNKELEYNTINPDITVDTSTSNNNKTTYIENKEKEVHDVACNTSNQDENKVEAKGNRIKEILDNFKKGDNTRFPTMDELRAIFIKENIHFTDEDFKNNSSGIINGKYKISPRNAAGAVNKYIRKPIIDYGFWYDSDNKNIQNAVISYINKNKLNVVVGNNY